MPKFFITGDRSRRMMPLEVPLVAGLLAGIMQSNWAAKATGQDEALIEIVTGDNTGVEQVVRDLLETLGATCHVVPTGVDPDTQEPAWDVRHEVVNALADKVVFIHTAPLESSIGKSLEQICGDKVEYAIAIA